MDARLLARVRRPAFEYRFGSLLMRHWWFAVTLAITSLGTSAALAAEPPFPRVGGINMGDPFNYNDPDYQAALAKLDVMILKTYPGRPSWNPAIRAIKRINPDALVFLYITANERDIRAQKGTGWNAYLQKLDSMKWWLYTSGTTGTPVQSPFGAGYRSINVTPYTKRDSSGLDAIEWITKFYVDEYYKPNSAADGFFMDNVLAAPNVDGDWNVDGKLDKKTDPAAATYWRQGYAAYFKKVRELMPGKIQIGNIGGLGAANAVYPEYAGLIDGGVVEGWIGKSWSVETFSGWKEMMNRYRKVMKAVTGRKIVIVNQWGDPKDYQAARYGITSCLMDNGYHSFTNTAAGYSGVVWFDEYDANLGAPVSLPPTAAWKNGIYRRDFENGIALVNPKGNGAKTVTLDGDFVALKGTQAPSINTGDTVRTVTLQDRDSIILKRLKPVTKPAAPAMTSLD